jgi:hypothetical protein
MQKGTKPDGCRINVTEVLKFIQHMKKYRDEHNGHTKDGILTKLLDKDKLHAL